MKAFWNRNYRDDNVHPEEAWLYRICLWLVAIGGVIVIFWR